MSCRSVGVKLTAVICVSISKIKSIYPSINPVSVSCCSFLIGLTGVLQSIPACSGCDARIHPWWGQTITRPVTGVKRLETHAHGNENQLKYNFGLIRIQMGCKLFCVLYFNPRFDPNVNPFNSKDVTWCCACIRHQCIFNQTRYVKHVWCRALRWNKYSGHLPSVCNIPVRRKFEIISHSARNYDS